MKIALATQQGGLEDEISQIVGRTPTFTIVTLENDTISDTEVIQNQFSGARSGAGIQAAQMLSDKGIDGIIGGNFGPNLAKVFNQSGVSMYQYQGGTVKEAIRQLIEGNLTETGGATESAGRGKGPRTGSGGSAGAGRGSGNPGQGKGTNPGTAQQ